MVLAAAGETICVTHGTLAQTNDSYVFALTGLAVSPNCFGIAPSVTGTIYGSVPQ